MSLIDARNPLINKPFDDYILPAQLKVSSSIQGLLGLANYLKTAKEPAHGWWITLGKRLILIKNTENQQGMHLYVKDHGPIDKILKDTVSSLLKFDDEGRKNSTDCFYFVKFYEKFIDNKKELFKNRFFIKYTPNESNATYETLFFELISSEMINGRPYINPTTDPNILPLSWEEQNIFAQNAFCNIMLEENVEAFEEIFVTTLERIRFKSILIKTYVIMLHGDPDPDKNTFGLSAFFTQINKIFHAQDARLLRLFFILKEMLKNSVIDSPKFLLRPPVHSFGKSENGESYKVFAEEFNTYSNLNKKNNVQIAQEMRKILKGNELSDQKYLSFLPNLTAVWFYSEAARNKVSILSGLILLDFIEKDIQHSDEDGNNLYSWKHTLVHPRKDQQKYIEDLYGRSIPLGKFDGMHPMAHGGSVKDGKKPLESENLTPKQRQLSPVQQKEGHLLTHWLYEMLKNKYTIEFETSFSNPNYEAIKKLLLPSKNNLKNSKFKRKHVLFLEIKQLMINRLSTLDCLLL